MKTHERFSTRPDTNETRPQRRAARALPVAAALAALLAATPTAPSAQTPEARGLEIAKAADARDSGFGDQTASLVMILRNRHGEESSRALRVRTLEGEGDGDKSLVVFDRPMDVAGTALLTFTHKADDDDQWLYLPALKRVKRIASTNKSGPFVGSEFAYEDLSSQEIEKYTYRYLRDEPMDGMPAHVVERVPVDPRSGYTRQVVWWDRAELRPLKIDYYDRKGELLKTLTFHGYVEYLDRFWRAGEMKMVNHQTGKSTELQWSDYAFRTGLTARDFNQTTLKEARTS